MEPDIRMAMDVVKAIEDHSKSASARRRLRRKKAKEGAKRSRRVGPNWQDGALVAVVTEDVKGVHASAILAASQKLVARGIKEPRSLGGFKTDGGNLITYLGAGISPLK